MVTIFIFDGVTLQTSHSYISAIIDLILCLLWKIGYTLIETNNLKEKTISIMTLPDVRIIGSYVELSPRIKVLFRSRDWCRHTLVVHAQSPPL